MYESHDALHETSQLTSNRNLKNPRCVVIKVGFRRRIQLPPPQNAVTVADVVSALTLLPRRAGTGSGVASVQLREIRIEADDSDITTTRSVRDF